MNQFVDPEQTHAIVVGIERYAAGETWRLPGPATDAVRCVGWLRASRVPASQITVLLSPLSPSAVSLPDGITYDEPTLGNIYTVARETLHQADGKLLVMFWGGHGFLARDGRLRLLLADAREQAYTAIDVEELRHLLRTDAIRSLRQQILLVDACSNPIDLPIDQINHVQFPNGAYRDGVSQFVLYSTRTGEAAGNSATQPHGYFASVVLDELERAGPGIWPPPMQGDGGVASRVAARFVQLRAHGHADQTPTELRVKDWDDRWDVIGGAVDASLAQLAATLGALNLSEKKIHALWARSLPRGFLTGDAMGSMAERVALLEDVVHLPGTGPHPLVQFVERAYQETPRRRGRARLDEWLEAWATREGIDSEALRAWRRRVQEQDHLSARTSLTVRLRADMSTRPRDCSRYQLKAWLRRGQDDFQPFAWIDATQPVLTLRDDALRSIQVPSEPLEEIQQRVCSLVCHLAQFLGEDFIDLTVEFLLPLARLKDPIESWECSAWEETPNRQLGYHLPVVVRRADRPVALRGHWVRLWHCLKLGNFTQVEAAFHWLTEDRSSNVTKDTLYEHLTSANPTQPCVYLEPSSQSAQRSDMNALFSTAITTAPVVLWIDPPVGESATVNSHMIDKVTVLLVERGVAALPWIIRDLRRNTLRLTARRAILLWDDPEREPGENRLAFAT